MTLKNLGLLYIKQLDMAKRRQENKENMPYICLASQVPLVTQVQVCAVASHCHLQHARNFRLGSLTISWLSQQSREYIGFWEHTWNTFPFLSSSTFNIYGYLWDTPASWIETCLLWQKLSATTSQRGERAWANHTLETVSSGHYVPSSETFHFSLMTEHYIFQEF